MVGRPPTFSPLPHGARARQRQDDMGLVARQHVELDFSQLKDKALLDIVGGIKLAATTSQLVLGSQTMQTCVATLLGMLVAFTTATTAVTNDRAKLKTDLATEAQSRG